MKKALLLLLCSILLSWSLFATQLNVLAEIFSSTGCPYCPSAQLGLQQLYDGHPNVIPISWYTSLLGSTVISPNANARLSWYGGSGIPDARIAGNISVVGGGGTSMYSTYLQRYNQVISRVSPLEITPSLDLNGNNQLVITANINVTQEFTETNNKVCFVITQHPASPPYRFLALGYSELPFTLTSVGQNQEFTASIPYDDNWNLENIKAVVFVQTWSGDKKVLQAAQTGFSGLMSLYTADVTSGPKDLTVNFTDKSLPVGNIFEWKWDFDNDGTIDSFEQNPSHTYTQEGTYSVALTISDGIEEHTTLKENFITVTGVDNVSGSVQGVWKPEYGVYNITDDITIPENCSLVIMPGTQLKFADNKLLTINGSLDTSTNSGDPICFTADNFWKGIIISPSAGTTEFLNCRFEKALATAIKTTNSNIIVTSCLFTNNNASATAGAIDLANTNESYIFGSYFANNTSSNNCSAVNVTNSTLTVKNSVFVNNTGRNAGAFMIRNNSTVNLINNTITNNVFNVSPGGQVLVNNSSLNVMNSIIRGTSTINSINGTVLVEYSDITGGYEGTGNIDTDPLFVNPTTIEGYQGLSYYDGWYLNSASPCIDAGNPDEYYNDHLNPSNPSEVAFPCMGSIRNDMGAFGGSTVINWLGESNVVVEKPLSASLDTYPNPFNPNVTIQFNRLNNTNQKVNVAIYNAKGQKVNNLFDSYSNNKSIQITWNGKNSNNTSMPSGIYFVKASAGNESITKKIVLLK